MVWRHPAAWIGLLSLLIPIAIHLLVRQHAEPRPFPTLRFIEATRLAAVRRKRLSDWTLLAVRLGILAFVVAALADPLWQTAARREAWMNRTSRAIVMDTTTGAAGPDASRADATDSAGASGAATSGPRVSEEVRRAAEREAAEAFHSATFDSGADDGARLGVSIRRAVAWLRTAPPARRELVILSDFQAGALDASMLADVPAHVGLRFVRTSAMPATRTATGLPYTHGPASHGTSRGDAGSAGGGTAAAREAGAAATFALHAPRVTVNTRETAVAWSPVESRTLPAFTRTANGIDVQPYGVRVQADADDRPALEAAARAVFAEGVPLPASEAAQRGANNTTGRGATGAARSDRARPSAIVVTRAAKAAKAGGLPDKAVALAAPWMADVARRIAEDDVLAEATGRASIADAFPLAAPPAPWLTLSRDARGRPALVAAAIPGRAAGSFELALVSRMAADSEATALLLRAVLRATAARGRPDDGLTEAEVMTLPDATLAGWQRPSSDPPASEWQRVDGGDRRWLWGAVLALLAIEPLLRRRAKEITAGDERGYEHAA